MGRSKGTSNKENETETAPKMSKDDRSAFSAGRSEDTDKIVNKTLTTMPGGSQPVSHVVRPKDKEITCYSPVRQLVTKSKWGSIVL